MEKVILSSAYDTQIIRTGDVYRVVHRGEEICRDMPKKLAVELFKRMLKFHRKVYA